MSRYENSRRSSSRAEHGRDRTLLGEPREGVRNEGEDVDLQKEAGSEKPGRDKDTPSSRSMSRTQRSTSGRSTRLELEDVVGHAGIHVPRGRGPGRLLDDLEPDELEGVVLVLLGGGRASRSTSIEAPRGTSRSSRITGLPRACLDSTTRARRPPARDARRIAPRVVARFLHEERAVMPCGLPTRPTQRGRSSRRREGLRPATGPADVLSASSCALG